jgi:hypothetical protein
MQLPRALGGVVGGVTALRVATQLSPAGSVTVTVPVGVTLSPAGDVTVTWTVTPCPTTGELVLTEVIAVVGTAAITVSGTAGETLVLKLPSPE